MFTPLLHYKYGNLFTLDPIHVNVSGKLQHIIEMSSRHKEFVAA